MGGVSQRLIEIFRTPHGQTVRMTELFNEVIESTAKMAIQQEK